MIAEFIIIAIKMEATYIFNNHNDFDNKHVRGLDNYFSNLYLFSNIFFIAFYTNKLIMNLF